MNYAQFKFKRDLIDRKNREAADKRMNEEELSFKPLFWVVIALALLAFFMGPR